MAYLEISEIFEIYILEFFEYKNLKKNSERAYRVDLNFLENFLSKNNINFESLSRTSFSESLKNLKERAKNRKLVNIRQFLLWLKAKKNIKILPEWEIPIKRQDPVPKQRDLPPDINSEEILSFINSPKLKLKFKIILNLIFETGISIEELASLEWPDINIKNKLAFIEIKKNKKHRLIPISQNLSELFSQLKNNNLNSQAVFLKERELEAMSSDFISVSLRDLSKKILGYKLTPTQIQEVSKQSMKKSQGIKYTLEIIDKKHISCLLKQDKNMPKYDEKYKEFLKSLHKKSFI